MQKRISRLIMYFFKYLNSVRFLIPDLHEFSHDMAKTPGRQLRNLSQWQAVVWWLMNINKDT